ncbi:centromere protein S-like isoform X2 [Acanthaster planci]|uniref:Centromere protein S n=1 Tax=Acanthaster planci TaxID=133434 RepID=A0A8B7XXW2_ACAPL|nr:centromere protein S-like isoform X1 [Acanthaster planci]XP_022085729.1 centromere protein S-like isoform X2 [Acanthaster planci]
MAEQEEYDNLAYVQRLNAAVHYSAGQICEELSQELDVTFSRQFIAVLSEATFKQCAVFATDLEHFAQHGKRSVINADDVKLLARRSAPLAKHIRDLSEQQNMENEAEREKRKSKKVKKSSKSAAVD